MAEHQLPPLPECDSYCTHKDMHDYEVWSAGQMREYAIAAIALASPPVAWISVTERLPTEEETCEGRVAVLDQGGYAVIGLVHINGIITGSSDATHWLRLPAPPAAMKGVNHG